MTEVPTWLKPILESNKCPRCSHRLVREHLVNNKTGEVAEHLVCPRNYRHFRCRMDTYELTM